MTHICIAVDLRDCGNVGAIARTATAFGFDALITVGTTPPLTRKEARKAALGGHALPTKHFVTLAAALAAHPDYAPVAIETSGIPLDTWNPQPTTPIALIVGNERYGLSHHDCALATTVVRIPHQTAKVASLNVASAFAIAAYTLWMVH